VRFEGTAHRYGRDVDTDVIIPARYLNTSDPVELAKHCMEDLDAGFVGKVACGDILVADENFGCGSSREHAPISIKAAGISVIIAKSFARIFYRNVTTGESWQAQAFPPFIKGIIEKGGLIEVAKEKVAR
jgi:3-isopropylmalate/(R)-2-methylmalate dehydratase small subunit